MRGSRLRLERSAWRGGCYRSTNTIVKALTRRYARIEWSVQIQRRRRRRRRKHEGNEEEVRRPKVSSPPSYFHNRPSCMRVRRKTWNLGCSANRSVFEKVYLFVREKVGRDIFLSSPYSMRRIREMILRSPVKSTFFFLRENEKEFRSKRNE